MRNPFSCKVWKLSICVVVLLAFHFTAKSQQCTATAGALTPNPIVGFDISATSDMSAVVPTGFSVTYVLTSGLNFIIEGVSPDPMFTVGSAGNFTIHTLVFDPAILDLSIVEFGVTTALEVNPLLIQGGGTICAALDLTGATFMVEELPDSCSLSCKSVNISIGLTTERNADGVIISSVCEAVLGPDDVLTGPCSEDGVMYIIEINDHHGELVFETDEPIAFDANVIIDPSGLIGEEVQVNVIAVVGSTVLNSCWNTAMIEDKRSPEIDCRNTDIIMDQRVVKCCDGSQIDQSLMRNVFTECSDFKVVILEQNDRVVDCTNLAEENFSRIIMVTAFAVDEYGNKSNECDITIRVERLFPEITIDPNTAPILCSESPELDSTLLICPPDLVLRDGNAIDCALIDDDFSHFVTLNTADGPIQVPAPVPVLEGGSGVPILIKDINPLCAGADPDDEENDQVTEETVFLRILDRKHPDALTLLSNCNVGVSYSDLYLGQTNCVTKIRRTFSIREWHCSGEDEILCVQYIEIADTEGPVVLEEDQIDDFEVSTNGFDCSATVNLPYVEFIDNCGDIDHIDVIHPNGILRDFDKLSERERFINIPEGGPYDVIYRAFDGCKQFADDTIRISVWDNTPPVPICDDNLVVSLTFDGAAQVFATSFDDGSYDDCGLKTTVVRKMDSGNCDDCSIHPPVFEDFTSLGIYDGHYYYLSDKPVIRRKAEQLGIAYGGYLLAFDGNAGIPADAELDEAEQMTLDSLIGLESDWIDGRLQAFFGMDIPDFFSTDRIITSTNKPELEELDINEQVYIIELENPCGFSNSIHFCCGDIAGDETLVVLRAIDKWGNFNECMISVELQDKSQPQLICPPNLVLACEFSPVDVDNLGAFFGTVINGGQLEAIDGFVLTGSGSMASNFVGFYPGEKPEGESTPDPNVVSFNNGYALDNCATNLVIEELDPMDMRDECGRGDIIRKFIAYNPGQREFATDPCEQLLEFIPTDTFNFETINTTELVDTMLCISEVGTAFCVDFDTNTENLFPPSEFGEPSFPGEDNCDLLGVQVEDQILFAGNTVRNCTGDKNKSEFCYKIIREFQIINWCNFNNNQVAGVFDDRVQLDPQVILIKDDVDPFIVNNPNFGHQDKQKFCSFDQSCGPATVVIQRRGNVRGTSCSARADLEWYYCLTNEDGSVVIEGQQDGFELVYEQELPIGTYTFEYALYDKCGNSVSRVTNIVVEYCKAPTAYCLNGLAVSLNEHGNVTLWASDFTRNVNTICADGVAVSFSATDITQTNVLLCCEDVGTMTIPIYFTTVDENGEIPDHEGELIVRQSFCEATISVQDNGNVCNGDNMMGCDGKPDDVVNADGMSAAISGSISRPDEVMVSGVNVTLEGSTSSVNTGLNGEYAFPNMAIGGEYIVNPQKSDKAINGVSTLDLVVIQKHILGSYTLDSPYKYIAADINSDESISALDIVDLRKVILGMSEDFPRNNVWNFISKDYRFFDESNPLADNYASTYRVSGLEEDMVIDFIGIKTGDVNFSAEINGFSNAESRSSEVLSLKVQEELTDHNKVALSVHSASDITIDGYQFTLDYDRENLVYKGLRFTNGSLLSANNFGAHIEEGAITVSWHEAVAAQIAEGQELFTIEFEKANGAVNFDKSEINSSITSAEAYADNQVIRIEQVDGSLQNEFGLILSQNTPNPFKDITNIDFVIPTAGNVSLMVHTYSGQLVANKSGYYQAGSNSFILRKDELNTTGVLYYTLSFNEEKLTKQLIIIN